MELHSGPFSYSPQSGMACSPSAGILAGSQAKDDTLMTKEEFFAGIDEAREQIKRGEGVTFTNLDEMNAWLNAL